jgi:colicin import membrane protein
MSEGTPRGFLLSATLHGAVAALLFLSFVMKRDDGEKPRVFELVAGEGDNYMAREAPALGSPGGVKLDLPKPPEPKPLLPEPVQELVPAPAPTPPTPTPPPPTTTPPDTTTPNFKKQIQRNVIRAESQAKREIKKERDAEAKRASEEKKRISIEEFNKANKSKSATTTGKNTPTKVAKIDAEGIAKGVVGGSTANKVGGAGGKALTNDNDDALAGYFTKFKLEVRRNFEAPPGLSDSLQATFEVRANADGTFTNPRVVKSSGSAEFDRAVIDAIRRIRVFAPRPDKKSDLVEFIFNMRERNEP